MGVVMGGDLRSSRSMLIIDHHILETKLKNSIKDTRN